MATTFDCHWKKYGQLDTDEKNESFISTTVHTYSTYLNIQGA